MLPISMNQYISIAGIILALLFYLPTRLFKEHPFVVKHKLWLQGAALFVILSLLAFRFYIEGIMVGIIAVVLGGAALAKYIYDTSKQDKQE